MTTLRAAGERLHPFTDTVFVARRPTVLNMSGVRQCLQDSLQLQIQRVSAGWTGEQPCTAGMSRCVGRPPVPMAGNDFERHEFFVIIISFWLAGDVLSSDIFLWFWCQQTSSALVVSTY